MIMDGFSLNARTMIPFLHFTGITNTIVTVPKTGRPGPLFFAAKHTTYNHGQADMNDDACKVDEDQFDDKSFSKLLWKVSLAEAKLYAQMAYLGSLSYTIPKIKVGNPLKRHRLRFITSSLEKSLERPVADGLNSSPCDWFICDDDDETSIRYFVIQGSESIASWQANILFEPIQFEAMDAIVHRGIYEAAKALYQQLLPHVDEHLRRHGNRASLRLTGHSLGGSLSLLVNLMLLIRGQVPVSSLLPVITFGAPWIMCGGDSLLHNLGLPRNHLQGIMLHRDIVPRIFSCNYPSQVADLLKAVNENFRNHSCLNNQNLLYAPMGELLILQPDAKLSPSHHLLPSGSGFYVLRANSQTRVALSVFLNTPHPLEILSERCAYGPKGGIQRDHDVETYLTSIRQEVNRMRKQQIHSWQFWWQNGCLEWLRRVIIS